MWYTYSYQHQNQLCCVGTSLALSLWSISCCKEAAMLRDRGSRSSGGSSASSSSQDKSRTFIWLWVTCNNHAHKTELWLNKSIRKHLLQTHIAICISFVRLRQCIGHFGNFLFLFIYLFITTKMNYIFSDCLWRLQHDNSTSLNSSPNS